MKRSEASLEAHPWLFVPHWVYRAYDQRGRLLYVGCTSKPQSRFRAHGKGSPWWPQAEGFTWVRYPDYWSAMDAERLAIKAERPEYNIVHNPGVGSAFAREVWARRKAAAA